MMEVFEEEGLVDHADVQPIKEKVWPLHSNKPYRSGIGC